MTKVTFAGYELSPYTGESAVLKTATGIAFSVPRDLVPSGAAPGMTLNVQIEAVSTLDAAPYGYCPICHTPGEFRERRPDGNDTCANGHTYPSRNAVKS